MIGDCAIYVDGRRRAVEVPLDRARDEAGACGGFVWVDLTDPTGDELADLQKAFGFHDLLMQGVREPHQRPKLERHDGAMLLVLKQAHYIDRDEVVELAELMLVVATGLVVVIRRGPAADLTGVRERVEGQADILGKGPGAVLYAVVDAVVDGYAPVLEGVDNDIRELEEDVFSESGNRPPVERIYMLKREVLQFHMATAPLEEPLDRLARGSVVHGTQGLEPYFQDAANRLVRVVSRVDGFRDLLTSILEAALTQVGVRQNEDMRKISAWIAIAAVPTLVAGLYGMNFEHMPELEWRFGYPLVLAVIVTVCLTLHRTFRRNGWL